MNQSGNDDPVLLRPAMEDDSDIILKWQSQDQTRLHFHEPSIPTPLEHANWFKKCLEDPDRHLNIIIHNGRRVGVVRLDKAGENCLDVSIIIAPECCRLGIGTAALNEARKLWPKEFLKAEVLPGNKASHALFRKCGYEQQGKGLYINRPGQ